MSALRSSTRTRSKTTKTIAVTGGAGFVGGHLIDALLLRGYRVICLDLFTYAGSLDHLVAARAAYPHRIVDRLLKPEMLSDPTIKLVVMRCDLNDTATLAQVFSKCDGCMALAAETHVDFSFHAPGAFVRANVNGVQSVLEAMRTAAPGRRLLHVSTDEVYGEALKGFTPETAPLKPRNVYAATKACGDLLVGAYAGVFDLDVVTVRPCNLFGPRQQPKDLIPKTFAHLLHGELMPIHGDGRHVREYLFVKDAVKLIIEVFERGDRGEIYNLSSHEFHSTLEIVGLIARSLGLRSKAMVTFVPDRPNPDRRYAGDNTKIKQLLGRRWKLTPLADALVEMSADFAQRRPKPIL